MGYVENSRVVAGMVAGLAKLSPVYGALDPRGHARAQEQFVSGLLNLDTLRTGNVPRWAGSFVPDVAIAAATAGTATGAGATARAGTTAARVASGASGDLAGSMLRRGARGTFSGRPFYHPDNLGGPIRELDFARASVTDAGVDVVERHLLRFTNNGPLEAPEQAMVERLRRISSGELPATDYDLRFYTHEAREYVRYRKAGWPEGQPPDELAAYELWNDLHAASLEDYRISEQRDPLYHPEVPDGR